jgi:hypothetical protein
MLKLLLILVSGASFAADTRLTRFEGTWIVDPRAEERSSDTGPFFDGFRLAISGGTVRQQFLFGEARSGDVPVLATYTARESQGEVIRKNGRKQVAIARTEYHVDKDRLLLRWKSAAGDDLTMTLRCSPDRRSLWFRMTSNAEARLEQVTVLHKGRAPRR